MSNNDVKWSKYSPLSVNGKNFAQIEVSQDGYVIYEDGRRERNPEKKKRRKRLQNLKDLWSLLSIFGLDSNGVDMPLLMDIIIAKLGVTKSTAKKYAKDMRYYNTKIPKMKEIDFLG